MFLDTSGGSLLEKILTGKGVLRAGECKIRAGQGTIRGGHDF